MIINGTEIWEKVIQDDDYMSKGFENEKTAKILQEYVEKDLLKVLAPLLDKPATIDNLLSARILFIKDALNSGLLLKIFNSMPEELFIFFDADDLIELTKDLLAQLIEILELIANDFMAFLQNNGISEKTLYQQIGINSENSKKAISGKLTICDILLSQPTVFLKSSD